ncbi:hypothetical protein N657DRAFT_644375 [Parathielavia appendiculata]|uniref:Uncharacterized protein n=1 Tax=Parathielavia appendiculata TaxID=2587402 RepID=A0AAN6U0R8_9PEZI|nr:hypothetical protein N657DRAFT_644375 [Parathielavia appendiculata]
MAHLPPNAAIFSPSVARAAASAAKDWSYVDTWLQRKFPGRGPPPFERNPDTLRVLLALASANEAADEEQALIARLEAQTLEQLRAHERSQQDDNTQNPTENPPTITLQSAREAILTSLETSLTRDGQTALTAMATLALQTGTPLPTPSALGSELLSLSTQAAAIEQATARIDTLTAYLTREAEATAQLAHELRVPSPSDDHHHPSLEKETEDIDDAAAVHSSNNEPKRTGYHPPPNLSLQNLSTQRRIKHLQSTCLPELRDKVAALAAKSSSVHPSASSFSSSPSSSSSSSPSIGQVRQEEEAYLSLLAEKKSLDAAVRAFAGLPPDTEQARKQLETLRAELRRMVVRRDEVFEGLVERESPKKRGSSNSRSSKQRS